MSATEYRHPGRTLDQRVKAFLDSEITSPVTRGLVIDLVAALAEQGEPEWEYGWRSHFENGEEYEWLGCSSRAAAEEDIRVLQEEEDRNPGEGHLTYSLRKREVRKPGPWLPVEENGENA